MTHKIAMGLILMTMGVQAGEIIPTTSDGPILNTGVTYTIVSDGTAREIWSAGASDTGRWYWLNGFPEFVSASTQTLTVTFSEPVALNRFVVGVNSISSGEFTLALTGGTASLTDFDLADGIADVGGMGLANFDPATGIFDANSNDLSLMIGSSSSNTITSFSISGDNSPYGYTLFFAPVGDGIFTDSFDVLMQH